jgi:uncharacterized repeat protein (TIGR03803 family)
VFKLDAKGNETVLHTFTGGVSDGGDIWAGLIRDKAGNLYGATRNGGASNVGTVFKLSKTGKMINVRSFDGTDGAYPLAGLVRDAAGNFYGAVSSGGDLSCNAPYGCGTIFELGSAGALTALHTFAGGASDGALPLYGSLLMDAQGNLYGTTQEGGDITCPLNPQFGCGTVYELSNTGTLTLLHTFAGSDGAFPTGGLIRDAAGNLYGTTDQGGAYGYGTVFEITP